MARVLDSSGQYAVAVRTRPVLDEAIMLIRGDTKPDILFQVYDYSDDTPIDFGQFPFATCTIYFKRVCDGTVVTITTAVLVSAHAGQWLWTWPADVLDVDEGEYVAEVEIDWSGDGLQMQTVPTQIPFFLFEDYP